MHPILLDFVIPGIGARIVLPTYGFFLASAFLAAIQLGHHRAMKKGYDPDVMGNFYLVLILSSMVGARSTYVWLEWDRFAERPWEAFLLWKGGLVFYGGLVGGFIGCWLYVKYHRMDPWAVADLVAPCLALGHLIGRMGCFFNGCCYGGPSSAPWACTFPFGAHDLVPRHPTQIYEVLGLIVIFIVLSRMFWAGRTPGTVAIAYAVLYAPLRFVVEMYRADDRGGWFFGLSISQLISIVVFIAGLAAWAVLVVRARSSART